MKSQRLKVGDQIPGGVLAQLGVRPAGAAAALVEQHNVITLRIKETPHRRVSGASRAAVQEDDRFSFRVTALLVVQFVELRDAQIALVEWPDRRIQRAGGGRFGPSGRFGAGGRSGGGARFGRGSAPGRGSLSGRSGSPGRRPGLACGACRRGAPAGCGAPGRASAVLQTETMGPRGLPPSRWTCRWATSMPLSRLQLTISR